MTAVKEFDSSNAPTEKGPSGSHFIRAIIENDARNNNNGGTIVTRFPPEPNGYLHIGHAKSICLNFGLARDYEGSCNLRFDDTNPTTEDVEYVDAIKRDVRWLGFDWGDSEFYASDYFTQLYAFAVHLIETGNAYVDSLSEAEIRANRGTVTSPGTPSRFRDRSISENLDLFHRMRSGEFRDGEHVLRAKIDLASNNMKMRDPLLYRIRHATHYRSVDEWCIYPMYDFAHPLSDAIEGVTHSLCTLEFESNRELYDWVLDNTVKPPRPHQYEFARLNLDYTVMSKRKLLMLVNDGYVTGWDDPRMPTLAGFRRRGVRASAIRHFCDAIGVAKADNRVDVGLLEHTIRDDLNFEAPRVMAVLRPLKVVITNYPEGRSEWLDAPYWPHDVPKEASRLIPFSREIYIDRDDFREKPPKNYFRLAPGREVRLRYGYFITCTSVVKTDEGEIMELHCTYDSETRGGNAPDGRKVRGTIHWVSANHAVRAEVRLYDRLFTVPDPEAGEESFVQLINPESLIVLMDSVIEPSVEGDDKSTRYQFEREGYFWRDSEDSDDEHLVFNRIVPLRDTWGKMQKRGADNERDITRERDCASSNHGGRDRDKSHATQAAPPSIEERMDALSTRQRDRFVRMSGAQGVADDEALILAENPHMAAYFDNVLGFYDAPRSIAKWIVHELLREVKERSVEEIGIAPQQLADLVRLVDEDLISGRIAKDVLEETIQTGLDPSDIVEARGLKQLSDPDDLVPVVDAVVKSHSRKVEQYREGKKGLMGFFMGQVMRQTGGKANPEMVREILESRLEGT